MVERGNIKKEKHFMLRKFVLENMQNFFVDLEQILLKK